MVRTEASQGLHHQIVCHDYRRAVPHEKWPSIEPERSNPSCRRSSGQTGERQTGHKRDKRGHPSYREESDKRGHPSYREERDTRPAHVGKTVPPIIPGRTEHPAGARFNARRTMPACRPGHNGATHHTRQNSALGRSRLHARRTMPARLPEVSGSRRAPCLRPLGPERLLIQRIIPSQPA